jgi:hypothetical protein
MRAETLALASTAWLLLISASKSTVPIIPQSRPVIVPGQVSAGVAFAGVIPSTRRARRTCSMRSSQVRRDYLGIARGELKVFEDWIPQPLLSALRQDVASLHAAGRFSASGLSNQAAGDRNEFDDCDRLCLTARDPAN